MKSIKKKIFSLCLAVTSISSLFISACTDTSKEDLSKYETKETVAINTVARERYSNPLTEEQMPGRWDAESGLSRLGDPYLLRYNGEYYLYCSTDGWVSKYRCWKTQNLIDYEYLGEFDLLNAAGEKDSIEMQCAFAPEVYYWNGDFYMITSPGGRGHFFLKSVDGTPYGDYQAVTNNFGLAFDGSVFIDDDEKMYFLNGDNYGTACYEMESITNPLINTEMSLGNGGFQSWTEGPILFKRDGVYYALATGEQVISPGYRINYAYSEASSPMAQEFVNPTDNTLTLDTLSTNIALGHGWAFMGPDLDSYYLAYHSLRSYATARTYNINRIEFSGTRMTVTETISGAQMPNMPEFYVLPDGSTYGETQSALVEENGQKLSNKATGTRFSAEYNFANIPTDGSFKLVFGGGYVTINGKKVELYKGTQKVAEGSLINDFDFTKVHSIRVAYDGERVTVAFDNMTKIDATVAGLGNGKIGYAGYTSQTVIGATIFSSDSFGSSDKKEAKIADGTFFAENYVEGDNASVLGNGSGVIKVANDTDDLENMYSDANALKLVKGDRAVYKIDVLEDGHYGLESLFSVSSDGAIVKIQIDDNDPIAIRIKKNDYSANPYQGEYEEVLDYLKKLLCEFKLTKGVHALTVKVEEGTFEAISYNLSKTSEYAPQYENSLADKVNAHYFSLWKIKDDAHYAKNGSNMMMFGSVGMTDYTVSVDIKLMSDDSGKAGLIVRMDNPSMNSSQHYGSAQGYFIYLDYMGLSFEKINYNASVIDSYTNSRLCGEYHNLKVTCIGNKITVSLDGKDTFSFVDPNPWSRGAIGFYSYGAEAYYKNLKVIPA